jgi:hypothetical protein
MTQETNEIQAAATIDLLCPLNTPGGVVSTIHLRRGKARDLVAAQRVDSDPGRRELALIARLSHEKLTLEDMEELDLADLASVQAAFQGLLVKPAG